jgi:hypothetical protein
MSKTDGKTGSKSKEIWIETVIHSAAVMLCSFQVASLCFGNTKTHLLPRMGGLFCWSKMEIFKKIFV